MPSNSKVSPFLILPSRTPTSRARGIDASIPLALDVGVRDGRIKKGDTLLFEGIGGGFSWGSILTEF